MSARAGIFVLWGMAVIGIALIIYAAWVEYAEAHTADTGQAYSQWCCNGDGHSGDCQPISKFEAENDRVYQGRNLRNYEPAPLAVWPIATKPFSEAHFATFPPELAERCILAGCPKGGLVLDPFGGAGTTALAALRHGRLAALIELNPDYAAIARKRIETEWRVPQREESPNFGPLFSGAAE